MNLFCDRYFRTSQTTCKKNLVVVERGIAKIIYFRLYKDKKEVTFKNVNTDSGIINALIALQVDCKVSEEDFKDIVINIKHAYNKLKNSRQEDKTLADLSTYYGSKGINMNLGYGILMHDESVVFFYDFSDVIQGRLNAIFNKGGLL